MAAEPSKSGVPWYLSTTSIVVSALVWGPLALPALWLRKDIRLAWKVAWTVLIVGMTVLLTVYTQRVIGDILGHFKELKEAADP